MNIPSILVGMILGDLASAVRQDKEINDWKYRLDGGSTPYTQETLLSM